MTEGLNLDSWYISAATSRQSHPMLSLHRLMISSKGETFPALFVAKYSEPAIDAGRDPLKYFLPSQAFC